MKPAMFSRMKSMFDDMLSNHRESESSHKLTSNTTLSEFAGFQQYGRLQSNLFYHRPLFLGLSKSEEQKSLHKKSRLLVTPKDNTSLPFNSGYCEVVNAGKSGLNEDCAVALTIHLQSLSLKECVCERHSSPLVNNQDRISQNSPVIPEEDSKANEDITPESESFSLKVTSLSDTDLETVMAPSTGGTEPSDVNDPDDSSCNLIPHDSDDDNDDVETSQLATEDSCTYLPENLEAKNKGSDESSTGGKQRDSSSDFYPGKSSTSSISQISQSACECCSSALRIDYFAIFDGHAGEGAALYASEVLHELLIERLREIQHLLVQHKGSQSTLIPAHLMSLSSSSSPFPRNMESVEAGSTRWTDLTPASLVIGVLQDVMLETDKHLAADQKQFDINGGCAALVVLVMLGKIFVAGAGDCRAILCRAENGDSPDKDKKRIITTPMSHDFTPNTERRRLQYLAYIQPSLLGTHFGRLEFVKRVEPGDIGKKLLCRDYHMTGWTYKEVTREDLKHPMIYGNGKNRRLLGTIGVTRGLGDHNLIALTHLRDVPMKPFLSAVPDVRTFDLLDGTHSDDDVLIMGSDGLWDVTSNETAADIVKSVLETLDKNDVNRYCFAAKELVLRARGTLVDGLWRMSDNFTASLDDISAFVIPVREAWISHKVT